MGAKVDLRDNDGFTPAYIAKSREYKVFMSNLLVSKPVVINHSLSEVSKCQVIHF